jgi:hypothetical protein
MGMHWSLADWVYATASYLQDRNVAKKVKRLLPPASFPEVVHKFTCNFVLLSNHKTPM